MKNIKRNIALIGLILVTAVGVTQVRKYYTNKEKPEQLAAQPAIEDDENAEDSLEVIGTPVNDDPWVEMSKVIDAWYAPAGKDCDGVIKVIDDNGDNEKIIEEQLFRYQSVGKQYYYQIDNLEMVSNKNQMLMVDNQNKKITIASATGDKARKFFDMGAFKKLLEEKKANARVTQLENEKILTVDSIQDVQVQGYRIHYDAQTGQIKKMLMGMSRFTPLEEEAPVTGSEEVTQYYYYVEVDFRNIKPLSVKEKDFNPERKFITLKKGKAELTPAFSGYQLINQH